jgi:hypothetical protein
MTGLEIVTQVGRAQIDYEANKIIFPGGHTCDYSKGSCFNPDDLGNVHWNLIIPDCSDTQRYGVVYSGIANKIVENCRDSKWRISYFLHSNQ